MNVYEAQAELKKQLSTIQSLASQVICPKPCTWDRLAEAMHICADAKTSALVTCKEVEGTIPLVLYFKTDSDADEFIEAFKQAMPSAVARKL